MLSPYLFISYAISILIDSLSTIGAAASKKYRLSSPINLDILFINSSEVKGPVATTTIPSKLLISFTSSLIISMFLFSLIFFVI